MKSWKTTTVVAFSALAISIASPSFAAAPQSTTRTSVATCLDIISRFPNGVAKNKKAKGLRQFPKARVSAAVYNQNRHLDSLFEPNGVICDPNDRKGLVISNASISMKIRGISLTLSGWCELSNPQLTYGSRVGTALIDYNYRCTMSVQNNDRNYSFDSGVLDGPFIFLVYDDLLGSYENGERSRAYFSPGSPRVKSVGRNTSGFFYSSGSDQLFGEKASIEALHNKMMNGLMPRMFLGATWFNDEGTGWNSSCFGTSQPNVDRNFPRMPSIPNSSMLCENLEKRTSSEFPNYKQVWD